MYYSTYEAAVESLPSGWEITKEIVGRRGYKLATACRVRPDGEVTCFAAIRPTRTPADGYKTVVWGITYQPCFATGVIQ
jgi:hypothetical protein